MYWTLSPYVLRKFIELSTQNYYLSLKNTASAQAIKLEIYSDDCAWFTTCFARDRLYKRILISMPMSFLSIIENKEIFSFMLNNEQWDRLKVDIKYTDH